MERWLEICAYRYANGPPEGEIVASMRSISLLDENMSLNVIHELECGYPGAPCTGGEVLLSAAEAGADR